MAFGSVDKVDKAQQKAATMIATIFKELCRESIMAGGLVVAHASEGRVKILPGETLVKVGDVRGRTSAQVLYSSGAVGALRTFLGRTWCRCLKQLGIMGHKRVKFVSG
jgi:hypothetical protein